jgi:hypothetical protein
VPRDEDNKGTEPAIDRTMAAAQVRNLVGLQGMIETGG